MLRWWQLVFITAKNVSKNLNAVYNLSDREILLTFYHVTFSALLDEMCKWITLAITNCCRTVGVTRHQTLNSSNTIFDVVAVGIAISLANCERAWCCLKCFYCIFIRSKLFQALVNDFMRSCRYWSRCINCKRGIYKIKKKETFISMKMTPDITRALIAWNTRSKTFLTIECLY